MIYIYAVTDTLHTKDSVCKMYSSITDTKKLHKQMKRYSDDMFETKGRQLIDIKVINNSIHHFNFTGRDIYFRYIGNK